MEGKVSRHRYMISSERSLASEIFRETFAWMPANARIIVYNGHFVQSIDFLEILRAISRIFEGVNGHLALLKLVVDPWIGTMTKKITARTSL